MAQGQELHDDGQTSCSSCGEGIPQDVLYCPYCGYRADSNPGFCPNCGASLRSGVRFCPSCGVANDLARGGIQGPSAVDIAAVEYMGFWIRFAAWIIDFVILFVAEIVVTAIGLAYLSIVINLAYVVLFIGLKGQTPGKIALGIQVVDQQGNVPGIGRAALREILGKLVSVIVIFLGCLWIGWDKQKRGWHDYIGGTYVVRKRRNRLPSF